MLRSSFAALVLSSALVVPAIAAADDPKVISVTGEAQVSAPPDLALIDGGVTTEAKTAREASDSNNTAMGKVLLALKGAGIPEKDIQTQRLSLHPQYAQNRVSGPSVVSGYRASNRVTIKLRDMTIVAPTIDLLVGAGANEIGGISFTVAQPSKLLDDARTEAIADARRKAEIYAKAAGVTLGAPVSISEVGAPGPMMLRGKMAASFAAPAPVAPGEETLRISVAVSWTIKPMADLPKVVPEPPPPVPPNPVPVPPVPTVQAPPPIPPAPVPQ